MCMPPYRIQTSLAATGIRFTLCSLTWWETDEVDIAHCISTKLCSLGKANIEIRPMAFLLRKYILKLKTIIIYDGPLSASRISPPFLSNSAVFGCNRATYPSFHNSVYPFPSWSTPYLSISFLVHSLYVPP